MNGQRLAGLILLAVGSVLLLVTTTDLDGSWLLVGVGAAFLAAFVATRSYGMLVPGGIITGLGVGVVLDRLGQPSPVVPLGLGLGFVSIALVHLLTGGRSEGWWWWPLIPGGILSVTATAELADIDNLGAYLVPVVLIVVGLGLLLGRRGGGDRDHDPPPPAPGPPPTG